VITVLSVQKVINASIAGIIIGAEACSPDSVIVVPLVQKVINALLAADTFFNS
jgi:hypothetical protein